MERTPEEIKKGLTTCLSRGQEGQCDKCPYYDIVLESCKDVLKTETISLIQQLEAQVPRWISVEERLPGERLCVSVYIQEDGGAYWIETAFRRDGKWRIQGEYVIDRIITHWRHLPQPPKD